MGQDLGHTDKVPALQLQGPTADVESNAPFRDLDRYR